MDYIHKTAKVLFKIDKHSSQSVLLQSIVSILFKVPLNVGFETKMHNFLVNHVSLHETVASSFRETEESQRNILRAYFVYS